MATIDGRPAQYGITLKQLRELMELRGREGVNKINSYGGVQEICKKLYTSPSEGKLSVNYHVQYTFLNLIQFNGDIEKVFIGILAVILVIRLFKIYGFTLANMKLSKALEYFRTIIVYYFFITN